MKISVQIAFFFKKHQGFALKCIYILWVCLHADNVNLVKYGTHI